MKNKRLFAICAVLMVILGASDAMRGIFSPLFLSSFGFSVSQVGIIVSMSYLGNLVCLLMGGVILDKISHKKSFVFFVLSLSLAELVLLLGNKYAFILIGFFLTLGISTLLNTTINLVSGQFSASKSLMYLNILFFLQGIGTTLSQFVLTRFSSSLKAWNMTLILFSSILVPVAVLFSRTTFSEERNVDKENERSGDSGKTDIPSTLLIILSLAFYLIAEHGVTNYIMIYGIDYLGLSSSSVGKALTLFSLGIMSGRLLFSPLIDRVGGRRMLLMSLLLAFLSLCGVFVFEIIYLTLPAGLASSIIYPTLVNYVKKYCPSAVKARMTTMVVSTASVADILFNFLFGFIVTNCGYRVSVYLLPIAAALSFVFFLILTKRCDG